MVHRPKPALKPAKVYSGKGGGAIVPGNPGNSGGKKGRSGRKPFDQVEFLRRCAQEPELQRVFRAWLASGSPQHWALALKYTTAQPTQKIDQKTTVEFVAVRSADWEKYKHLPPAANGNERVGRVER
jgi:hypothetical protein